MNTKKQLGILIDKLYKVETAALMQEEIPTLEIGRTTNLAETSGLSAVIDKLNELYNKS